MADELGGLPRPPGILSGRSVAPTGGLMRVVHVLLVVASGIGVLVSRLRGRAEVAASCRRLVMPWAAFVTCWAGLGWAALQITTTKAPSAYEGQVRNAAKARRKQAKPSETKRNLCQRARGP